MARPKALLAWSSGKDSAWALHVLRREARYDVIALVTTVNERVDRVAMHAVPGRLLDLQADAVGLPLWRVPIPDPCSNAEYEAAMAAVLARGRREGAVACAFGDLFLDDVRAYRERQLTGSGLAPLFPLWQEPTAELARGMLAGGVQAVLSCVDPRQLSADFAGRRFDAELLRQLPAGVDPCGERGEFHTFVCAGPMFRRDVPVTVAGTVTRDGFVFADLR
jgi:uncharacterized protein (TIGR00290 family)